MRYSSKITIPILCPIRFEAVELSTETRYYPNAFRYLQKWATSDDIHVQIFHELTGQALTLRQKYITGELKDQAFTETPMSTGKYCYDAIMKPLQDGVCYFQILSGSTVLCDSILGAIKAFGVDDFQFGYHIVGNHNDTVSIIYFNSTNDYNTRFDAYQSANLFTFRVEGGFIPSKFKPLNDMKVFTDSLMQNTLGYSNPSSSQDLIIGNTHGIPWYLAEKVNFMFACDVTLIRNAQWQALEPPTAEETAMFRQILTVPMSRKTNLYTENYGGQIYITDKYGAIITALVEGEDKALIL